MTLKAAIVGMGIMGTGVANVLARRSDAGIVAIAERSDAKREEAAARFNCQGFSSVDLLLNSVQPDIAFVATPDWDHLHAVMACMDRGVHVYCEKPLTTSTSEAAAIVRRVRETGLKLQVSYNHRWLAPYNAVWKKIHGGSIGRPLVGYARKNNPITVPTQMLASWARESSPMWFQSSHDIDLMTWWFDDMPTDVTCVGVKSVLKSRLGWDTYDAMQGQVRYGKGGVATFEAAWIYPETHPAMPDSFMAIVGESGHIQVDRKDEAIEMSTADGFSWPRSLLNAQVFDRWTGAFPACIESFLDAVINDRAPYVTAEDGFVATAVLEALHESASRNGERVLVKTLD
ncbi:MAG: hypothetical protein AMXMBFR84_17620 [Candidatus Hydrogenedentota bacterium]